MTKDRPVVVLFLCDSNVAGNSLGNNPDVRQEIFVRILTLPETQKHTSLILLIHDYTQIPCNFENLGPIFSVHSNQKNLSWS